MKAICLLAVILYICTMKCEKCGKEFTTKKGLSNHINACGKRRYSNYDERVYKRIMGKIKVNENTGCWEYTGSKSGQGYGTFCYVPNGGMKKQRFTHRFMYFYHNPLADKKLQVNHKCNNEICNNPAHLYTGTQDENIKDMIKAGTHSGINNKFVIGKSYCKKGHLITEDNYWICSGRVRCRQCNLDIKKKWYAKNFNNTRV